MLTLVALLAGAAVGDLARPTRGAASATICTSARCSCVRSSDVGSARTRARDVALVEPIARRDTMRVVDGLGGRSHPAYVVTLRVHARWKGASADTLQVLTMQNDILCGVAFEMGERYVVFTDEATGMSTVQACSLTALASQASRTLRALGTPSRAPWRDDHDGLPQKSLVGSELRAQFRRAPQQNAGTGPRFSP